MNTPNNNRKKQSQLKIEKVFATLLQTKDVKEISVTDICKLAKLNRSTFYANYIDIIDLIDKLGDKMINEFTLLYKEERDKKYNSNDFLKLFKHIKDNQIFYKTYFKLGLGKNIKTDIYDTHLAQKYYKDKFIDYHMVFFKAGITAIIKMWLDNNCKETPEEIQSIIISEYLPK